MQAALINSLTNENQVRELMYHYRAIRTFYEEYAGGPRSASAYKEYFVIRDTEAALYRRLTHLMISAANAEGGAV